MVLKTNTVCQFAYFALNVYVALRIYIKKNNDVKWKEKTDL